MLKEKIDMLEPTYLELKQSYTSVKAEKRKSFVDLKCKDEKLFEKKMHKKKYKNRLKGSLLKLSCCLRSLRVFSIKLKSFKI